MSFRLKNFSIKHFNQDVNLSHDPDGKYHRWLNYRQKISSLIFGSPQRCIVLGAGSLNDVDMAFLCSMSDEVILVDIDTVAVQQGIKRQHLPGELRQKIEIVQHDFSGAQNARLFEKLEEAARQEIPIRRFLNIMEEAMAGMKPEPLLPGQSFDLVLSCPIYTQLVLTQIEVLLKIMHAAGTYSYDELNRILVSAHQGMKGVIKRYNDLMLDLSGQDGQLVVLADILELQADDPDLAILIAQNEQNHLNNSLIHNMINEQGLELSIYGLADLAPRMEIDGDYFLIWSFDAAKSYVVRALIGRRKDIKYEL